MLRVGNRTIDSGGGAGGDGVDGGTALNEPDIDRRAEVIVGEPVQALDFAGKRLDCADSLCMRDTGMGGLARDFEFDERGTFAPRHEIATRPAGFRIEYSPRISCFCLDDRPRGGRGDLFIRGVEPSQRARRAKPSERVEHEGVHDEARFHVGDTRPEGLVAFDAERPLGGGAVGEDSVAMTHQHDRPVTAAAGGEPCRDAIAKSFIGEGFTGDARCFEPAPQSSADLIDAALVVAAGIDVYEISQQGHHRLMLPAEMFENGGLCLDAHRCAPIGLRRTRNDHRQRLHLTQSLCRCS
jgi:hypothetical protein